MRLQSSDCTVQIDCRMQIDGRAQIAGRRPNLPSNLQSAICILQFLVLTTAAACAPAPQYDVVIRHGTVYDGTGAAGVVEDLAILDDRVAARGDLGRARGREEV